MNGLNYIYFLLGGVICAVCLCAYYLRRILNILRQMNNGEPSGEDLRGMEYSKFRRKE